MITIPLLLPPVYYSVLFLDTVGEIYQIFVWIDMITFLTRPIFEIIHGTYLFKC